MRQRSPVDEARELATLLDVARSVASTLDFDLLLNLILDQLKVVVEYSGASIMALEGEMARFLEARGPNSPGRETDLIGRRLRALPSAIWDRLLRQESLIIDDVRADETPEARSYRLGTSRFLDTPAMNYVRSLLAVPLVYRDEVFGVLNLAHREPGFFTEHHARLAGAVATHAAIAIEHARLYERARTAQAAQARQIERMNTLTAITSQLLAATNLERVLDVVAESACRLIDADGSSVALIEDDGRRLVLGASAGRPRAVAEVYREVEIDDAYYAGTATGRAIARREPVVVEDYAAWNPGQEPHEQQAGAVAIGVRAFVVVPMLVDGTPIGTLRAHVTEPRSFPPEDVALVAALADQAALAIEHARLLRRGREAAVIEERARLARELHDSASQTVFSLGMLARAAQVQHERGAARLGDTLDRIGALAQDALFEMRSLLLELHPAALNEMGLSPALERLIAAMRVRGNLALTFEAPSGGRPRAEVELALFRIVQEALANVAKHARATEATVSMVERDGSLVVTVTDDGAGFAFDPAAPTASGGLGLRSMRERAAEAHITLTITSSPGAGTTICAVAPL
jgi:signal transduction histidine kinase